MQRFKFEWFFQTPGQLERHNACNYTFHTVMKLVAQKFCETQMQNETKFCLLLQLKWWNKAF